MKMLDMSNTSSLEIYLRRGAAIIAGLAALLLPGGLLVMYVIWLYRRSHLAHGKTLPVKA